MATSTDLLKIVVLLQDRASRGFHTLNRSLGTVRRGIAGLSTSMLSLKGLIATVGAGLLARSFIKAASTAEQYRVRLNVLLGSVEEGNRLFKDMADYASTVSFQYEEIMGGATQLAGVMRGGVDEIKQWMPLIADLAAVSGLSIQEATGQIVRMYSAGAASADLFRERGITAMLGFTAGVTYSAKETRKRLMEAFKDPQSIFAGASVALAKTWDGMLSMMSDRWFQFRNMVMEGGVFEFIKAALDTVLKKLQKMKDEGRLDTWSQNMAKVVVQSLEWIAMAAAWVGDIFRGWVMIFRGVQLSVVAYTKLMVWSFDVLLATAELVLTVYTKILEFQKQLGEAIAQLGIKLQVAGEKLGALGGAVAKIGEGLSAMGTAFANDTQTGIDKINGWKEGLKGVRDENAQVQDQLTGILETITAKLEKTAMEIPVHERIKKLLEEIHAQIELNREAEEKLNKGLKRPKPKTDTGAGAVESAQTQIAKMHETTKTMLAELDRAYELGTKAIRKYFSERVALLLAEYEFERDLLQQQIAAEDDPKKKEALKLKLFQLEEGWKRTLIELEREYTNAIKDRASAEQQAADIVAQAKERAATSGEGAGMAATFAAEIGELERRQREEMDRLLELKKKGYATDEQLQDLHNAQILEKEKLLADQRQRLINKYLDTTKNILGGVADAFLDYYKQTGSKHKELFQVYKAAAIAEAIIATYQSAQDAYKSLVGIPYVGPTLAVAAAGAAIASGLARVAAIRAQEMAEGGKIPGTSPHDRADNVPIWATAGEYMHPVKTVRHYGLAAMDAIRTMRVPRHVLQSFAAPGVGIIGGMHYAAGGPIADRASSNITNISGDDVAGARTLSMQTNIALPETLDFISRRLEAEIEPVVLRILQEELKY